MNKNYVDDKEFYFLTTIFYLASMICYIFFNHWSFLVYPLVVVYCCSCWSILTLSSTEAFITDSYPSGGSLVSTVPMWVRALGAFWIAILWVKAGFFPVAIVAFICHSWIMFLNAAKLKFHKDKGWYNVTN